MRKILFAGALILLSFTAAFSWAKDFPIELSVDKDVAEVGDTIQLSLTFNNIRGIAAPQLPQLEGFKSQYLGPSTMLSIVNGRVSNSVTHRYILIAVKTGKFSIGPFSITEQGNKYTSPAKEITVLNRGQSAPQKSSRPLLPQYGVQPREELNDRIFLILNADKTKAYLNEQIPLTLKLYVNQLAVRDIQYPVLQEQGYVKEPFGQPKQYREELGGITYDVLEFNTTIYATREGQIELGPARLSCNIAVKKQKPQRRTGMDDFFDRDFFDDSFFDDFFGRFQVYPQELKSAGLSLQILPFPEEGKPKEFNGAVGKFNMAVNCSPKELKAGDPITLKMEISGEGNFDTVNVPEFSSTEGFKIYQPEVKKNGNSKTFEQVIIPQSEKTLQIPAIKFVYFDPEKKEYITLEQPPAEIKVLPAAEKESKMVDASLPHEPAAHTAKTQILGQDIVYIKEDLGVLRKKGEELYRNRLFIYLQLLPFLFLTGAVVFQSRRERLNTDNRYARMLRAPKVARLGLKQAKEYLKNNNREKFYDSIFKTLQEYLGHRFNRPSAGITMDVVEELVSREGLNEETAEKLKICFSDCDNARYSTAGFDLERMKKTLFSLEEAIDYLERKRR